MQPDSEREGHDSTPHEPSAEQPRAGLDAAAPGEGLGGPMSPRELAARVRELEERARRVSAPFLLEAALREAGELRLQAVQAAERTYAEAVEAAEREARRITAEAERRSRAALEEARAEGERRAAEYLERARAEAERARRGAAEQREETRRELERVSADFKASIDRMLGSLRSDKPGAPAAPERAAADTSAPFVVGSSVVAPSAAEHTPREDRGATPSSEVSPPPAQESVPATHEASPATPVAPTQGLHPSAEPSPAAAPTMAVAGESHSPSPARPADAPTVEWPAEWADVGGAANGPPTSRRPDPDWPERFGGALPGRTRPAQADWASEFVPAVPERVSPPKDNPKGEAGAEDKPADGGKSEGEDRPPRGGFRLPNWLSM